MPPIARRCLAGWLLSLPVAGAWAQPAVLSISTNNTPADRRVLQRLGEEALRRAGLGLRLLSLPSERSLVAANAGEVDGEGLRVAGLEVIYPDLLQVPEPFTTIRFVAFARDPRIRVDQGWDSLKPYRIAFLNGWKIFEARAGGARSVHKVDLPEQLFRMLEHDRVDLALYTRTDGVALANSLKLDRIRALEPALADADLFLYLHRRHAALLPRIAQALREMKADGSHRRLLAGVATP